MVLSYEMHDALQLSQPSPFCCSSKLDVTWINTNPVWFPAVSPWTSMFNVFAWFPVADLQKKRQINPGPSKWLATNEPARSANTSCGACFLCLMTPIQNDNPCGMANQLVSPDVPSKWHPSDLGVPNRNTSSRPLKSQPGVIGVCPSISGCFLNRSNSKLPSVDENCLEIEITWVI